MSHLSRRSALTLGAALGLVGATGTTPAWGWSSSGSLAGVPGTTDPAWVWDDEIDRIIAQAFAAGQVGSINDAIRPWVNNNDALPSGLPSELSSWLGRNTQLPPWADMDKLRLAADFNRRKDTYMFMLYGLGSGIMSTVIPREAKAVYWSKGGRDMKERAAKTFTFGYDLAELNAFEPNGQFIVTANKTRMVHAAVRHLLPQLRQWSVGATEPKKIPISNHDILVTFHSLGTFVHTKFKEWNIRMSAAEEEAFLHSWQVAIHFLGVHEQFIPKTWHEAHKQSKHVLTPTLAVTAEGQALAETLLGLLSELDMGISRGFLNEFVRYVLGNQIADWLDLPRDYLAAATIRTGWPAYIAFRESTISVMPSTYYVFDQIVRAVAMMFLNEGSSTQTTPIELPDTNRI